MSNYIQNLRKYVGHLPIIMCASGVIIRNPDKEILLQHRSDNNCWGLPGGAVELGEEVEEAARREVYEETGLVVNDLKFFGVFSGKKMYNKYPNGDEVYIIANVFITDNYSGNIRSDKNESKDLKFFKIDKLPDNINPPDIPILESYINLTL